MIYLVDIGQWELRRNHINGGAYKICLLTIQSMTRQSYNHSEKQDLKMVFKITAITAFLCSYGYVFGTWQVAHIYDSHSILQSCDLHRQLHRQLPINKVNEETSRKSQATVKLRLSTCGNLLNCIQS